MPGSHELYSGFLRSRASFACGDPISNDIERSPAMLAPIHRPMPPAYRPPAPLGGLAPVAPPPPPPAPMPYAPAAPWEPAPVAPRHMDGWYGLGEVAMTLVGTPVLGLAGAGLGFAIAGPVGAARGAAIGASAPGVFFALKEVVTHLLDRGQPIKFDPKFVAAQLLMPGLTLAGAGIGFAIGGPAGAAIGALVPGLLPPAALLVSGLASWVRSWFRSPATTYPPPAAPVKEANPAAMAWPGYQPIYPPRG